MSDYLYSAFPDLEQAYKAGLKFASTQGADARPVAWRARGYAQFKTGKPSGWRYYDGAAKPNLNNPECCDIEPLYATRDAAPSADAKRLKQLEHALVYVAHSMHSEPQYMLAEGITLGDVSFVRVKVADIDVSVELPESVARAMYEAARHATATKDDERRIAIASIAPREKT